MWPVQQAVFNPGPIAPQGQAAHPGRTGEKRYHYPWLPESAKAPTED